MLQPRLHHRALIAAAGAAVSLLLLAAPARADVAQATLVSPGGAQQTLALGALAGSEDVVARDYLLRSTTGETTVTLTGFSPAALIDAAGADPYGFSYLEVQRPGGGTVLLSRPQALESGTFPEGPPVIYASAAGTGFLRPSSGAGDDNAADSFEAPQGVTLVLRKGSPLQVEASASTLKTEVGKPVRFTAAVAGAAAGEPLSYSWYFDDGGSAESEEASHRFAEPGSYDVVLGVTSEGDDTGASDVVTVQVGEPIAGPDRKGGGRNEAADSPDHGAAAGPSQGSAGGSSGSGAGATSLPNAPAPSDPPTLEGEAAVRSAERDKVRVQRQPTGSRVSGELVSATTAPPPPRRPQAEARRGSLDGVSTGGGGLPPAAWGGLATVGLLGLGGLLEARGLTGLLPNLRRRGIA